jgi:hypothetical protein
MALAAHLLNVTSALYLLIGKHVIRSCEIDRKTVQSTEQRRLKTFRPPPHAQVFNTLHIRF